MPDPDLLYWYDERSGERWTQREIQQYIEAPDARKRGASWWGGYTTFEGSPLSRGLFQHDMWGVSPSGRWDWDGLREEVKVWGVRNSLCTALMPTASTAQIMGNNECFEPFSNLLYVRRTLAGDFVILNKYLVRELLKRGLWNRDLKEWMVASNGSVQKIPEIPQDLRRIYKTVYEVKQKVMIECAAARAPFVDQTQSMNLFFIDPAPNVVSAALLFGWKRGLKTMLYYLRSQPSVQAQQVTVDPKKLKALQEGGARKQEEARQGETRGEGGARSRFQQRMAERGLASSSGANTPDCEFCSA